MRRLGKDGLPALEDGARGQAHVVFSQSVRYPEQGDAVRRHPVGVGGDLHPPLDLSRSLDLENALDVRKRGEDLGLHDALQVGGVTVGDYAELDDRELVGIEAAYGGLLDPADERDVVHD